MQDIDRDSRAIRVDSPQLGDEVLGAALQVKWIGLVDEVRTRTVRGYKTWPGMDSGLMAAGVGVA
jgi:hypothetical protein